MRNDAAMKHPPASSTRRFRVLPSHLYESGKVRSLPRFVPTITFALLLVSLSLALRFHAVRTALPSHSSRSAGVQPDAPPSLFATRFNSLVTSHATSSRTLPTPPTDYPHKCHIVGYDPARGVDWAFNTRAFCLTSAVCIRPNTIETNSHLYTGADPAQTTCSVTHPSLRPVVPQPEADCHGLQHRHVHCAHGKYVMFSQPDCPVQRTLDELPARERAGLTWRGDDEIGVIAPALPFSTNIYHFSYTAASIAHVVEHLADLQRDWLAPLTQGRSNTNSSASDAQQSSTPSSLRDTRLHVVMRGVPVDKAWQRTVLDALLRPHRGRFRSVKITWLYEHSRGGSLDGSNTRQALCFKRAVLLDARRNLNAWPFANGTSVSRNGDTVPAQSVLFRRAVLDAVGIASELPLHLPVEDGTRFVFPLPPKVLGYSRREMAKSSAHGEKIVHGRTRRFSASDEAWLRSTLRKEAKRAGFAVHEFKLSAGDSVQKQVSTMHGLGVVIGIHGANLVNAMLMHPFGGMMEIFAGGSNPRNLPCYVAGSNSGLAYQWHEGVPATRKESGCRRDDEACWKSPRGRLVKISRKEQRVDIRRKIAASLQRISRLHAVFPDGIPVRYDAIVGEFVIDDQRVDEE